MSKKKKTKKKMSAAQTDDMSRRADIIYILVQHIDVIMNKLDVIADFTDKDGDFDKFIHSKHGQSLVKDASSYRASKSGKLPKIHSDVLKSFNPHLEKVRSTALAISYVADWAISVKHALIDIGPHITDLDIRWNNNVVLLIAKLLVTFSKITTLINIRSLVYIIVQILPIIPQLRDYDLNLDHDKLSKFISYCTKGPYGFAAATFEKMEQTVSDLIAQISPNIIQILGQWPVIEWNDFSVFSQVEQTNDSTLPTNLHLVLSNIELFRDFIIFFCFLFPTYTENYPQYSTILTNAITEGLTIKLSPSFFCPISKLISVFNNTVKNKSLQELEEINEYERNLKFDISHPQRLNHVYYLLRDISDVTSYDPTYIPKLINHIIPLASLACYEVSQALSDGNIDEMVSRTIECLCDIGSSFKIQENVIKRFFLFNLTTIDATFLNSLYSSISKLNERWQSNIANIINEMTKALGSIDLEDFDGGSRYDLMPFIITANRLSFLFNDASTKLQTAYLHPIFEHLCTIIFHANLAQDPFGFFLSLVPIHRFWAHSAILKKYAKELPGGLSHNAGLLTIFPFFNYDALAYSMNDCMLTKAKPALTNIRNTLTFKFQEIIQNYLSPREKLIGISEHTSRYTVFDPKDFVIPADSFNRDYVEERIRFREGEVTLKEFMLNIPRAITLGDEEVPIGNFMCDHVGKKLAELMFDNKLPEISNMTYAFSAIPELLWPIHCIMGISFPKQLLECRWQQGNIGGPTSYLDKIAKIKGGNQLEESQEEEKPMITILMENIQQFITKGTNNTLYKTYGRRFEPINKEISPAMAQLLSYDGFLELFRNLGPQAAFWLNSIVVNEIGAIMVAIFQKHTHIINEVINWYNKYRAQSYSWVQNAINTPEIKQCAADFVRLGSCLRLRSLIRQAAADTLSNSIPGLYKILASAISREKNNQWGEKQDFLIEMASPLSTFHFIKFAIEKTSNLIKTTNASQFFFFLALLLLNPDWQNIDFYYDSESFSGNLHNIPDAFDAFLSIIECFVQDADDKKVDASLDTFFDTFAHVIQWKRKYSESGEFLEDSLIILADIFPKFVRKLQYGTIAESFPINVVLDAYIRLDKVQGKVKVSGKKKDKKRRKSKR